MMSYRSKMAFSILLGAAVLVVILAGTGQVLGQGEVLRRGEFYGLRGYNAEGHGALARTGTMTHELRLEDDFKVDDGLPGLELWLSIAERPMTEGEVLAGYVSLGPLTQTMGAQNHAIDPGVQIDDYRSAVIWCAPFDVIVGAAALLELELPTPTITPTATITPTITPAVSPSATLPPKATASATISPTATATLTVPPPPPPQPSPTDVSRWYAYLSLLLRQ